MRSICLALCCLSVLAHANERSAGEVAEAFFAALQVEDYAVARTMASDPQFIPAPDAGDSYRLDLYLTGFEARTGSDGKITGHATRFCREDSVFTVSFTKDENRILINAAKTLMAMYSSANPEPTETYCYPFKDQPLQATINGKLWSPHHVDRTQFDFGGRKVEKLFVVAEPCESGQCFGLSTPRIEISDLDFTGNGGNLRIGHGVTIYEPSKPPQTLLEGSYRVTHLNDGNIKLELSIQHKGADMQGYLVL